MEFKSQCRFFLYVSSGESSIISLYKCLSDILSKFCFISSHINSTRTAIAPYNTRNAHVYVKFHAPCGRKKRFVFIAM